MNWPYFTNNYAPLPGRIKTHHEDFVVEEIPAYEPSGEGDHIYFGVEKRGITTMGAIGRIAAALNINQRQIGVAGMKDAHAVSRQTMSVEHIDPQIIRNLKLSNISILWTKRHRNKYKTGHLLGNRFGIKLRETDTNRIGEVQAILEILSSYGVPNYYGEQRFGSRGDTWQVGRALLKKDWKKAISIIAGSPSETDTGNVKTARMLVEAGDYALAAKTWPKGYNDLCSLCSALAKRPREPQKAVMGLNRRLLSLYVSAYQSYLFNQIVAARINNLNQVIDGDLAWKHDKGVVFKVEDASIENCRAQKGEISPSGPMFGKRMSKPFGQSRENELALLKQDNLRIEDFPKSGPLQCAGGRRPLRFFPDTPTAQVKKDKHGEFIEFCFGLESGCYATVLLREICKNQLKTGKAEQ